MEVEKQPRVLVVETRRQVIIEVEAHPDFDADEIAMSFFQQPFEEGAGDEEYVTLTKIVRQVGDEEVFGGWEVVDDLKKRPASERKQLAVFAPDGRLLLGTSFRSMSDFQEESLRTIKFV